MNVSFLPVAPNAVAIFDPLAEQLAQLRETHARALDEGLAGGLDEAKATPERDAVIVRGINALNQAIAAVSAEIEAKPDRPVYRIAVGTYLQRAAWRRDVRATGCRYPGDAEMYAVLRGLVRAAAPERLDAMLELIDQHEAAMAAQGTGATVDEDLNADFAQVERLALEIPDYARLDAERQHWREVAPYMAARGFLVGWDNVTSDGAPLPFRRVESQAGQRHVPDELLARLPEADLRAIGNRAIRLMHVDKSAEKNSASPSPSPSSPTATPAA